MIRTHLILALLLLNVSISVANDHEATSPPGDKKEKSGKQMH